MYERKQEMNTKYRGKKRNQRISHDWISLICGRPAFQQQPLTGYKLLSVPNPSGVTGSTKEHDCSLMQVVKHSRGRDTHTQITALSIPYITLQRLLRSTANASCLSQDLSVTDTADLSHWSEWQLMKLDDNLKAKENEFFLLKQEKHREEKN